MSDKQNFLAKSQALLLDQEALWTQSYVVIFWQNWLWAKNQQFLIKSSLLCWARVVQRSSQEEPLCLMELQTQALRHRQSFMFILLIRKRSLDEEDFHRTNWLVSIVSLLEEELCFQNWDLFFIRNLLALLWACRLP